MIRNLFLIAVACAFLASGTLFGLASGLSSPWDSRPVRKSVEPYACPGVIELPRDVVAFDYYSDSKQSMIDPRRLRAYHAASAPFDQVVQNAENAADAFQYSGSGAAAACVMRILDAGALSRAMTGTMASNQSYYVQNWTIGALAVTFLKVRQSSEGSPPQRDRITKWMAT